MIDIPFGGWRKIVGDEFESEFLDLEYLRKKSEHVQPSLRRPSVRKLTTPDGRQYKLLYVPSGNARIREMLRIIKPIQGEAFIPRMLWADDHSLLLEFIEGDFPKVSSEKFSRDLGEVMARLHQYRFSPISKIRYRLEYRHNLKSLVRHKLLDVQQARKARQLYAVLEPPVLQRSLDYFDIARNNFVYDQQGALRLIDVGAFRRNRMMGQFFVGTSHFNELNTDAFWEAYLASTQNHYIYQHLGYLRLFHYVMKAGQRARSFASSADKTTLEAQRHWQRCTEMKDRLLALLDANS